IKHGGKATSFNRVVHEVYNTLHYLAKVRYNWLQNIPLQWTDKIKFFEAYRPVIITKRVTWQMPDARWFKCNTDGASRGNPGLSFYGFCVRDSTGDVIFAKANQIGVSTNL
ncbi:hypothetical protein A4A49_56551, partial [Nicotiana attenuata]